MSDFNINNAAKKIGLTSDQTQDLQAYYQKLSEAEKTKFGETDFLKLVEARGYKTSSPSESEGPTPATPSVKTPATPEQLKDLLHFFAGGATPGAAVMALLTEDAAEQRRLNRELRSAQVETTAKEIEEQSKLMMKKAVTQLVLGVVSGGISIASGISGAVQSGKALTGGLSSSDAALKNTSISSQQTVAQGGGKIVDAVSQYIGTKYDADIKKIDAKIEKSRAEADRFRELNEALEDLIRKCISTAEAISESSNQARAKILA